MTHAMEDELTFSEINHEIRESLMTRKLILLQIKLSDVLRYNLKLNSNYFLPFFEGEGDLKKNLYGKIRRGTFSLRP